MNYVEAGILDVSLGSKNDAGDVPRLDVIDLPSLRDKSTRILAINAVLETEWNLKREAWAEAMKKLPEEDQRVPTFIVVDEAHNLIPADPPSRSEATLRDQFRTIVAEGRKYGLFLILASQRPDKLDPMVLSECDNVAVMRINSASVMEKTARMLGQDQLFQSHLMRCREFETGRVLLNGAWVPDGPCFLYTAARRTIEGGRNLRTEHWAKRWVPPQKEIKSSSPGEVTTKKATVVNKHPVKKSQTPKVDKK